MVMEYLIHFQYQSLNHDYHVMEHDTNRLFEKGDILLWGSQKEGLKEWTIRDINFDVEKKRWQIHTIEGRWRG